MSQAVSVRAIEVRHLQSARAIVAAIAAVMITFSPDHSAQVGLSVFSGFAIVTALAFLLTVRSVYPAGARWPSVVIGVVSAVAGLVASIAGLRATTPFFVIVIAWAVVTGVVEVVAGARALRQARALSERRSDETKGAAQRSEARDALTVGILTLVLAAGLALVPSGFALQYYIEDAGRSFTLTGITIGVGVFGGYAAIVAVYLAIAALSPRPRATPDTTAAASADRAEA